MNRRHFLSMLPMAALPSLSAAEFLSQKRTFIGREKFDAVVRLALAGNWRAQPMGQRVALFGQALRGTRYVAWTLEIDDRVESPSVNFNGLDCWTFFETALGLARMIATPQPSYSPSDLLRQIEWTRYRGGVCRGGYLDRIHYLDEWFTDNAARGNIKYITSKIGPVTRMTGRTNDEMSLEPKIYRYLRASPALIPALNQIERRLEKVPFHYIRKEQVAACEGRIQSGDIIGIVTHRQHVFCSHVGLALHTADGACRFMHASLTAKRVIVDKPLHEYLAGIQAHAGIVVARPV